MATPRVHPLKTPSCKCVVAPYFESEEKLTWPPCNFWQRALKTHQPTEQEMRVFDARPKDFAFCNVRRLGGLIIYTLLSTGRARLFLSTLIISSNTAFKHFPYSYLQDRDLVIAAYHARSKLAVAV